MFEMFNGDSITVVGQKLKMPEPDSRAVQSTKAT
jgi:hypothetical protein